MRGLPEAIYPARIKNARKIDGWMDEIELNWLAEQAAKCQKIVEVGSWLGRSTTVLAENTSGLVFAVDTWLGAPEIPQELIGPPGWLFAEFKKNTKGLPVIPVQMLSVQAAGLFKRAGICDLDMIFIDASHDYVSVKADILAWQPLLKTGGILCGHDYSTYVGVRQAVDELLGAVKLPAYSIWVKEGI